MPAAPFAWTHEKTRVEFDGESLIVNGKPLPLDRIDRLARELTRSTAQGSWNRLDCGVLLLADGEVSKVRFRGDASKQEWGPWMPLWDQLDALVREEIEPRLVQRTIRQVADASFAEICPFTAKGRGRLVVTADSLQARKLFAKQIAWRTITDISGELIQITTVEPDGRQRTRNTGFGAAEWDAWQIPLLWRHFGAT